MKRRIFLKGCLISSGLVLLPDSRILSQLLNDTQNSENRTVNIFAISDLQKALAEGLARGGDFVEIYLENRHRTNITLEEGGIKSIQAGIDSGVGIRVLQGDATGYSYTDDLSPESLLEAVRKAAEMIKIKAKSHLLIPKLQRKEPPQIIKAEIPLDSVEDSRKISLMKRSFEAARKYDPRIKQVSVEYYDEVKDFMVANTEGLLIYDREPIIYYTVHALAQEGSIRHRGRQRVGISGGLELFEEHSPEEVAEDAAKEAVNMLAAKETPAGQMPVVVIHGWGGVLFHESIGHGLEADAIYTGTSYYTGRIGEKVGSELVTMEDSGNIPKLRGSNNIDDEGTLSQQNILIEKGILKGYMHNIMSERRLKAKRTGNGRRQSYRFPPMVRMTNTFIHNGPHHPEEVLAETKKGLFAKGFVGGVVDSTSGNFTFTVQEAYLIEDGKITYPVKGATLIGKGPEVLRTIDLVANDLSFGCGTCGKWQWVPVTSGQPTLRIGQITVGGTAFGEG